jgi:MFS transporter, ACS family, tartrate transporter
MQASTSRALEQVTLQKVYLRLVPYCFVLYILCYIDRINVSFAALSMNADLGLTAYVYGLAAGAFFWGYCLLVERPSEARWLRPEECAWLESELAKEKHEIESVRAFSILSVMTNPRVLVLSVLFGGIGMAGVGLVLFLPQILKSIGVSNTAAGLLTSVPYVFGTIAMVVCGHISDRTKDRHWILVVTCGCATVGLVLGAMLHSSLWVLAAFSLATTGFYGMKSPFWPLPSIFLTGPALAAGLALINSLGNFCGYLGPIAVGYAKDHTGSFEAGIYVLAAAALVSTLTALGCALWMPRTARHTGWVPARG